MIDAPNAASVGATMAPMAAATHSPAPEKSPAARAAPAPMVRGSPMPRRRTGSARSARSWRALTLEASAKSTSASATSASDLMVDECRLKWTRVVGPCVTARPNTTKAMGADTFQRSKRADTSPQTTKDAETTARAPRLRPCVMRRR